MEVLEVLEVLETRNLRAETVVVLWIDAGHVWGRPLLLCLVAIVGGYHRVLGFAEASVQDVVAIQQLFQDLLGRGLCQERGLLCSTVGTVALSHRLLKFLGPQICQHFSQVHRYEQVVSYFFDPLCIRNAITHILALLELTQAHTILMRIHAKMMYCNRSAAGCLIRDVGETLILHRSGLYGQVGPVRQVLALLHWIN